MENKKVYVIQEEDKSRPKLYDYIIGVASSIEKVDEIINKHYGEWTMLKFEDIRDSGIEFIKTIQVEDFNGIPYSVRVIVLSFNIDEV